MYNFRAKCVHVRDLARERFAEVDLEILRKVAPEHSESLDIRPAGPRHEVVLHALLDIVTREAIEKMRDEILNPQENKAGLHEEQDGGSADGGREEQKPQNQDGNRTTETEDENPGLKDQVNDLSDQTDDLNGRVDNLEGQVSEIVDDLNEQKKSGKRPQKSKKKTNTH